MRFIGCSLLILLVASVSACHAGMGPPVEGGGFQFFENGDGVVEDVPAVDSEGGDDPVVPPADPQTPLAAPETPPDVPGTSPDVPDTSPDDPDTPLAGELYGVCRTDGSCEPELVCRNNICRRDESLHFNTDTLHTGTDSHSDGTNMAGKSEFHQSDIGSDVTTWKGDGASVLHPAYDMADTSGLDRSGIGSNVQTQMGDGTFPLPPDCQRRERRAL